MTVQTTAVNEFSRHDLITDLKAEQLGAKPKDIAGLESLGRPRRRSCLKLR